MRRIIGLYSKLLLSEATIANRVLILTFGLFIGRLSGFIREWTLAKQFGVSADADLFSLALIFPDFVTNFLSSVSIAAVLYPLLRQDGIPVKVIFRFFNKIFLKIGIVAFVSLVIFSACKFHSENNYLIVLTISLLSIFPNIVTSISAAFLNFFGKTKAQALSTVVFNSVLIIGLLVTKSVIPLSLFILSAAVIRMLFMLLSYSKLSNQGKDLDFMTSTARNIFSARNILTPVMLASFSQVLILVNPFLDRLSLSNGSIGQVAIISYAEKLYMLPVTLFLTIIPYAITPEIFKLAQARGQKSIEYAIKPLMLLFLSGIIMTLGVLVFSNQIVEVILSSTGIPKKSLNEIAACLVGYSLMLPFMGPLNIMTSILLANNMGKSLCLKAAISLALKIILIVACSYLHLNAELISYTTSISIIFFTLLCCTLIFNFKNQV